MTVISVENIKGTWHDKTTFSLDSFFVYAITLSFELGTDGTVKWSVSYGPFNFVYQLRATHNPLRLSLRSSWISTWSYVPLSLLYIVRASVGNKGNCFLCTEWGLFEGLIILTILSIAFHSIWELCRISCCQLFPIPRGISDQSLLTDKSVLNDYHSIDWIVFYVQIHSDRILYVKSKLCTKRQALTIFYCKTHNCI